MKNLAKIEKKKGIAVTNINIEEFLIEQGIEFTESGEWLKMRCILPFDHIDHSPSMFIHKTNFNFNCFVCGSGSWSELCDIMEWDVSVQNIMVDLIPDSLFNNVLKKIKNLDKKEIDDIPAKKPNGIKLITKNNIECRKHYNYLLKRNIAESIKEFNISFTLVGDKNYGATYRNRIIISCHDSKGKYLWSEGRSILNINTKRKYYRPVGVNTGKYLFNYHRVIRKKFNWVIVVEGIIDAIQLWQWGVPGVSSYGSNISDDQILLLSNFDKIYACFDNDKAGIKGWIGNKTNYKSGFKNKIKNLGINVNRIILPKNKDVNDITKEKFHILLKKSKIIE